MPVKLIAMKFATRFWKIIYCTNGVGWRSTSGFKDDKWWKATQLKHNIWVYDMRQNALNIKDHFPLHVQIPANSTAKIYLPATALSNIFENNVF